jgi:uncharacterized protein (TIGR02444 family)
MQQVGSLWDYAVDLYGRTGVRDACLDLQDRLGLDVDLLLFAVWSAMVIKAQLDADAFRECIQLTEDWRENVVKPLRGLRRTTRQGVAGADDADAGQIADQLQAVELEAERVELAMLEQWGRGHGTTGPCENPGAAAASNLVGYLAAAGVQTRDAADGMRTLLAAAVSLA